ncbi:hypothetical protein [Geoglobus sp.]
MRGIIVALAIIVTFATAPVHAMDSVKVALVDHVDGFGKFVESYGVYDFGDTVTIYAQAENVNHFRAYAVDFVFVVFDPEDYPVAGGVVRKEGTDWTDQVYATFTVKVQDGWKEGKYRIEVYVFDVLNSTATKKEYDSFVDRLISGGSAGVSVHTLSRDDVDYVKREVHFQVKRGAESPIYIFDSSLKATTLPEGMGNTLYVTVLNPSGKAAEFRAELLVDGEAQQKLDVKLGPYEYERLKFDIPPLSEGTHRLEIAIGRGNVVKVKTLPVFIKPYLFSKQVLAGKAGDGIVVLSQNNYVLGSAGVSGMSEGEPRIPENGYDMNWENAAKMLTNILAYLWVNGGMNGEMKVGLYHRSDERAEKVLPELLDYIAKKSRAPLKYVGVLEEDELDKADLVFYVTSNPEMSEIENYLRSGGLVVIDVTDYYFDSTAIVKRYALRQAEGLASSFYDLTSINRTVTIKLKTELDLKPKIVYSNLSVSDFIVEVGKPVEISFDIRNDGGPGEENVYVRINDRIVFNETLTLYTNEKRHISFQYTPEKEGAYKVLLDDTTMSKVFFAKNFSKKEQVIPTPTPEVQQKTRENAPLIAALAALLAVLVIIRMYLR